MLKLSEIEKRYQEILSNLYPYDEIKNLFHIALEHTNDMKLSDYLFKKHETVDHSTEQALIDLADRLATGQPIQHILGEAPFYGLTFKVSPDTLIPRPETEELVHLILQNYSNKQGLHIIDIGTGTGCIAISLAKHLSKSQTWAIDISNGAIQIARENANKINVNIDFIMGDILEWNYVFQQEQKFDIIVSNPPYITPKEKKDMHINVLEHEPATALFVPEEAPLLFYDYIADFAINHLAKNGTLYFEINQYLAIETKNLLHKKGFSQVQIIRDINNVPRMIAAIIYG